MSDINWNEGAVCHGDGRQWFANTGYDNETLGLVNDDGRRKYSLYGMLNHPKDFQLNEIRIGDFIPASELDTEQKYNEVVEVFGLFGYLKSSTLSHKDVISLGGMMIDDEITIYAETPTFPAIKRQLTYSQIIAIGKLKRMMLEREYAKTQLEKWGDYAGKENAVKYNPDTMAIKDDGSVIAKTKRRNKSKQAYDILKSLDYEYDLVKQRWFKKQYID